MEIISCGLMLFASLFAATLGLPESNFRIVLVEQEIHLKINICNKFECYCVYAWTKFSSPFSALQACLQKLRNLWSKTALIFQNDPRDQITCKSIIIKKKA